MFCKLKLSCLSRQSFRWKLYLKLKLITWVDLFIYLFFFFFKQKMKDFSGNHEGSSAVRRFLGKTMWIISTSRNSIVVVIAMLLAYILQNNGYEPFKLTGIKFITFKNIIFIYPLVTRFWICHYESNICKRCWYSGLAWRQFETSTALAKVMGISLPPFQCDFLILSHWNLKLVLNY